MQSCPDDTSGTGTGAADGGPAAQGMVSRPRRSQALTLVIAVALVVIAVCLVLLVDQRAVVRAQPLSSAGARGVFAFTGQLTKGTYGVFMVDVDTATLWCYEYLPSKRELRLVSGRAWTYVQPRSKPRRDAVARRRSKPRHALRARDPTGVVAAR